VAKNLNIPLPFYSSLGEQNSKKDYVDNDSILIFESDRLPTFALWRALDPSGLTNVTVSIKDSYDNLIVTLVTATYLSLHTYTLAQYILPIDIALPSNLEEGNSYYIEIFDGTDTWYSEVFGVRDSMANYMKLSFSSGSILNSIMPNYDYEVFINQVLKVPEYPRFDDAEEKDGIKIYRSQILQKANVINVITTPEYLVDALMMLPMMDNVSLILQNGDSIDIQQVEVEDPEWTEKNKGATALLTIKLIEYTVIKKLNFAESGDPGSDEEPSVNDGYAYPSQTNIAFGETLNADSSVYINGILQDSTAYSILGDAIVMVTPMSSNDHYLVVNYKVQFVVSRDEYAVTISQSIFSLTEYVTGYVVVAVNGLTLNSDEYITGNHEVFLNVALTSGDTVIITNYIYGARSTRNDYTATAGQTDFTSGKIIKANLLVLVNGLAVDRYVYYTVSGDKIILSTPASLSDSVILINFNNS
jgi:hypothetical protein